MQVGFDMLARRLDARLGGFAVCVGDRLHRIDDDRDEQVEHGEGGDQDERDEEHPGIGKISITGRTMPIDQLSRVMT